MAYMSHSPYTGPTAQFPEPKWIVWHDKCAPSEQLPWAPDAMIGKAKCPTCRIPLTVYRVTVGDGWVFTGRITRYLHGVLTFTGSYGDVERLSGIVTNIRSDNDGRILWDIPTSRIASMRAI